VQLALLDSVVEGKLALGGNGKPTVVLVHLVNPFGFDRGRRFNEHNVRCGGSSDGYALTCAHSPHFFPIQVDLNRNDLSEAQWEQVLARPADFAGYATFEKFMSPSLLPAFSFIHSIVPDVYRFAEKALSQVELWVHFARGLKAMFEHGFTTLKRAIVTGCAGVVL
jgi:hypothetical protein